jgi:hypothetical protein
MKYKVGDRVKVLHSNDSAIPPNTIYKIVGTRVCCFSNAVFYKIAYDRFVFEFHESWLGSSVTIINTPKPF